VIEQGLKTAALMRGSDKSRGYRLEMICADFQAGRTCKRATLTLSAWQSIDSWGCFLPSREKKSSNRLRQYVELATAKTKPPTSPAGRLPRALEASSASR